LIDNIASSTFVTAGMEQNSVRPISPVTQFALLLIPVVMTCFFLVYSLTGWILEGRDKMKCLAVSLAESVQLDTHYFGVVADCIGICKRKFVAGP